MSVDFPRNTGVKAACSDGFFWFIGQKWRRAAPQDLIRNRDPEDTMAVYDPVQALNQVTLAAIANAAVDESLAKVKAAILVELAKPAYDTQGKWSLVWGPVFGTRESNMVYVARNRDTGNLSVVLRGTVMTVTSFWEDVPTSQSICPYTTGAKTRVSTHFLEAVQGMLGVADETGTTLPQFLSQAAGSRQDMTVFVAGHSQGAALVQIMLAWVMQASANWPNAGLTQCIAYASAPPSPGDPAFASWLKAQGNSFQIINPLDTIPYWYGRIDQLAPDNVPEPIPDTLEGAAIRDGLKVWADVARRAGQWQQADTIVTLRAVQLPPSVSYVDQAKNQHTHNSYLYLMGGTQTDIGPASLLPGNSPPVSGAC